MMPDLSALRKAVQADPPFAELFAIFPNLRIRGNITTAKYLRDHLYRARRREVSFSRVIGWLRTLQALGFGDLHDPTLTTRGRLVWRVAPHAVAGAVLSEHGVIYEADLLWQSDRPRLSENASPTGGSAPRMASPAGAGIEWLELSFRLRAGLDIPVHLPADLTPEEAARLAHFIHAHAAGA